MRKMLLVLFIFLVSTCYAQNPTYQDKLYYTCKVWGFIKYYHSEVSVCHVNWDSVLRNQLPAIKAAITNDEFNNELSNMIKAAGPMAIASMPLPDTLPADLKRNRNFSWLNDPMIRADVKAELGIIKDNFLPHNICWARRGTNIPSYDFPYDNPIMDINTTNNFPNEVARLEIVFRYWNIINYYNPYNYVLDKPWDSTLYAGLPEVISASNSLEFFRTIKRIASGLNDAHAENLTSSLSYTAVAGPQIVIKHIEGEYVVVKSGEPGIAIGDIVISVDGKGVKQWDDSLAQYISAGNEAIFHRIMSQKYLLCGPSNTNVSVAIQNGMGNTNYFTLTRTILISDTWNNVYYNDTLANKSWSTIGCHTGYVNMGRLTTGEVGRMYNDLRSKPVIIFDIRKYPLSTAFLMPDRMFPDQKDVATFDIADTDYPGTFRTTTVAFGQKNNINAYKGKIILLMNEESQSQAEYSCMILEAMPDVTKIGSQTAGTDGNIASFRITKDINGGFTGYGVFYPNGDSTQRIGIVPDIIAKPTIAGIRQGRDEVLEVAMATACQWLSIPETGKRESGLKLYPNPVSQTLSIESSAFINNKVTIQVINLVGQLLMTKETDAHTEIVHLNTESLASGMYLLHVKAGAKEYHTKFTRQ